MPKQAGQVSNTYLTIAKLVELVGIDNPHPLAVSIKSLNSLITSAALERAGMARIDAFSAERPDPHTHSVQGIASAEGVRESQCKAMQMPDLDDI